MTGVSHTKSPAQPSSDPRGIVTGANWPSRREGSLGSCFPLLLGQRDPEVTGEAMGGGGLSNPGCHPEVASPLGCLQRRLQQGTQPHLQNPTPLPEARDRPGVRGGRWPQLATHSDSREPVALAALAHG